MALAALVTAAFIPARCGAQSAWTITVEAGQHDRRQVPVKANLAVEEAEIGSRVKLVDAAGKPLPAQLTDPGLLSEADAAKGKVPQQLHFVVPKLAAGEKAVYRATLAGKEVGGGGFAWHDTPGKYTELRFGDRPVLRYMYRAFDDSTKQDRLETYKVFHHLFDPAGERIVTNGPTGEAPYGSQVRYPHHRGIFYGFSKMSYEGVSRADLWHCQGDHFQQHEKRLASEAGPMLGRHRVEISWHGKGKKTFATEQRELTAYHVEGGQLVEFASRLTSEVGPVKIDGDPQHAGFQFRAHNDVAAKTGSQTYYIRVDGVGKKKETRNWPGDKSQVDFPWKGMSFVLDDQRYTVAYLDKPTNPKPARFSERDYGRFGSYFEAEIDNDKSLTVNYRLWLQAGQMQPEQIAALSNDFVDPPKVTVGAE